MSLLAFASCIKDDRDACPGNMHFHFSFVYGGENRFFEMQKSDLRLLFYHAGEGVRYRDTEVSRSAIGPQQPYVVEKTPYDVDSLELISWSSDTAVAYVSTPEIPLGTGYVQLKEITAGSGVCRPVDDLFYGRLRFDAGGRYERNEETIPYVRAVSRIRITMIPQTVQDGGGTITRTVQGPACDAATEPGGNVSSKAATIIPHAEDYTFHLQGTLSRIDDTNTTGGEKIILRPECYYDEASGNVMTNWFGAFASPEGEYLKVNVFIRNEPVASFDCAPIGVSSVPGDYVDLVIDGHYVKPVMEVRVNGWRIASLTSNM